MPYSGTEFIVLLNTSDATTIHMCIDRISSEFDTFNNINTKPYSLDMATTYCNYNSI